MGNVMTRHQCTLLALAALAAGTTGCNHHVFSPPARTMPLESPATLPPGDTGAAVEGTHHGEVFGPEVSTGSLRIRHGLAEDLDGVAEANVLHVHGDSEAGTHPNAYSLRLGAKLRLVEHFAFTMGAGGGGSAAGHFFSPDVGVVLGYENEHLVPFMSFRTTVSLPIDPQEVDTTAVGSDGEPELDTPKVTGGLSWTAGLRLPLPVADPEHQGVRGSVVLGIGMTHLYDGDDDANLIGVGGGGELVF